MSAIEIARGLGFLVDVNEGGISRRAKLYDRRFCRFVYVWQEREAFGPNAEASRIERADLLRNEETPESIECACKMLLAAVAIAREWDAERAGKEWKA